MKTIEVTTERLERGMQNQKRAYYALSNEKVEEEEATLAVQDFLDETDSTVEFEFIGLNAFMAEGLCYKHCTEFHSTNL